MKYNIAILLLTSLGCAGSTTVRCGSSGCYEQNNSRSSMAPEGCVWGDSNTDCPTHLARTEAPPRVLKNRDEAVNAGVAMGILAGTAIAVLATSAMVSGGIGLYEWLDEN